MQAMHEERHAPARMRVQKYKNNVDHPDPMQPETDRSTSVQSLL